MTGCGSISAVDNATVAAAFIHFIKHNSLITGFKDKPIESLKKAL
jgi:hypothetical protein